MAQLMLELERLKAERQALIAQSAADSHEAQVAKRDQLVADIVASAKARAKRVAPRIEKAFAELSDAIAEDATLSATARELLGRLAQVVQPGSGGSGAFINASHMVETSTGPITTMLHDLLQRAAAVGSKLPQAIELRGFSNTHEDHSGYTKRQAEQLEAVLKSWTVPTADTEQQSEDADAKLMRELGLEGAV